MSSHFKLGFVCAVIVLFIVHERLPAQLTWQWVSPLPQGNSLRAVKILDDSTFVAVGEAGTFMKTESGGITWDVKFETGGSRKNLCDVFFINNSVGLIVGDSGTILRTTDGGVKWARQIDPSQGNLKSIKFIDSRTGFIAGVTDNPSGGGVLLTTDDGGITWRIQHQINGVSFGSMSFSDHKNGFVAGSIILRTTNGGNSWRQVGTEGATDIVALDSVKAVKVWGYSVSVSTDAGATWSIRSTGTDQFYGLSFDSPTHGIAVGGASSPIAVERSTMILRTTDGGMNWDALSTDATNALTSVSIAGGDKGIAVGLNGTIIQPVAGIPTLWRLQTRGTTESLNDISFIDSHIGAIVGQNKTLYSTTNGGSVWAHRDIPYPYYFELHAVDFSSKLHGTAVGLGINVETVDGGRSWYPKVEPEGDDVFFVNERQGYIAGGAIYHTTNGGSNWTLQPSADSIFGNSLQHIHFIDSSVGFAVGTGGTVLKTTNGGLDWITQPNVDYHLSSVSFANVNEGLISSQFGGIYRTSDGGESWTQTYGREYTYFGDIKYLSDSVAIVVGWTYASFGAVALLSTDGGITWTNTKIPAANGLEAIEFVPTGDGKGVIYIAGGGGTILCASIGNGVAKTWVGAVSNSWFSDRNWSPEGVPTAADSVIIPSTSDDPVIDFVQPQIIVGSLNILAGARLLLREQLPRFVVLSDVLIHGTLEISTAVHTDFIVGGSWNVDLSGDQGFVPGRSTVHFNGQGTFERVFHNVAFDTNSVMTSKNNTSVRNQCAIFKDVRLQLSDTLLIQNAQPEAIVGGGKFLSGTIRREILANTSESYRFESESTYVSFTGKMNPSSVTMTNYSNTLPPKNSPWEVVRPVRIDTSTNTIAAGSITEFSRWAIGIVRPTGMDSGCGGPAFDTIFVKRFYDVVADPDSGFVAQLALRYEQDEVPWCVKEDSLVLLRSDSLTQVSAGDENNTNIPGRYALEQNYPNPFNSLTVIRYQLPVRSHVLLKIYNVLGQLVDKPLDVDEAEGIKKVTWSSPGCSSGVYFYRLDAVPLRNPRITFSQVRKMLLIK